MRITLVHSGALGDTILLLELARGLKERFPFCHLTLVMRPAFGQLLVMRGYADAWASADDPAHSRWFGPMEAEKGPAWAECDLLISAVSNGRDAWADHARAAMAAREPCGGAAVFDAPCRLFFFEPRPPAGDPRHVTQYHRDQLAEQGLLLPKPAPAARLVNPAGRILLHPGSGGEAKCWPREAYLHLAAELVRNGVVPTFVLGEAEAERWGSRAIVELEETYPTLFHMGLFELSEKMRRARLYLGNDSGVTHLAAALGLPTIALFGPSDERQWAPVGPRVNLLLAPQRHDLASLEAAVVLEALLGELARLDA